MYFEDTYPLIKSADKTGTQPDLSTWCVYSFLSTITIQQGKSKKYTPTTTNVVHKCVSVND